MKREAELQKALEEKNREIESIRQMEVDKSNIQDSLKQMFQEEKTAMNDEMQEFLKTFQRQKDETAQRL